MKFCTWICVLICFSSIAVAGDEVVENGVLHVHNNATPDQGYEVLELEEFWRIGGEDEEFIFRSISSVILANDGDVYILDGRSAMIYVNSLSDGSAIRSMSIQGEGPGELRIAQRMFLMGENDLGVLQKHPGKLIRIDYQGIPQQSYDIRGNSFFNAGFGACQDETLVISGIDNDVRNGQMFLARFDSYGEMHRYESYSVKSSVFKIELTEEEDYFFIYKPWDISQDSRVYFAPYWSLGEQGYYLINVYDPQGKKERVFTRKYQAHKRSDDEKKKIALQKWCGEDGLRLAKDRGIKYIPEDYEPDVLEILAHPDGNIWVRTTQGMCNQDSGIMLSYDVFSPQGHFIKQVGLAVEANADRDIVYFLNEDTVVVVKGQSSVEFGCSLSEAEDILEIICYGFHKR